MSYDYVAKALKLPKLGKQFTVALLDATLGVAATWMAFSLRLEVLHEPMGLEWVPYLLAPPLAGVVFFLAGLYRAVFRYTGIRGMLGVGRAVAVYAVVLCAILWWLFFPGVPRSIGVLQPLVLLLLVIAMRAFAPSLLVPHAQSSRQRLPVSRMLIYGAGTAGVQIADALSKSRGFTLIGFIDDDPGLHGRTIDGLRIYPPKELSTLIVRHRVTDLLLALPSVSRARRNQILEDLHGYPVHLRTLPPLESLARGGVSAADVQELDVEDLLGRDPIEPDPMLIGSTVTDKIILVTGAGGSIGSELSRQILAGKPAKLMLVEHNEYSLYAIYTELQGGVARISPRTELIPLLGNVCNYARISEICRTWHPHTVYHAAAYKHVPLVERNAAEGIRNNVFGTLTTARASIENNVANYVLVSTDKAVRPTNIMGASKRLAEMILQALAASGVVVFDSGAPSESVVNSTRLSMVRFGNVLGSSGSVVPLFRQQVKSGGPITLTHEHVTRYFMTIPEAAQLVLQASAMATGGDVFVLDMGRPIRIIDLARRMVRLSGLTVRDDQDPNGDIEIQITGLQAGEKLYEELLIGENPQPTVHPRIMKASEEMLPWAQLRERLRALTIALSANDVIAIRAMLAELVNGYQPSSELVDSVYLANDFERPSVPNSAQAAAAKAAPAL